MTAYFTGLPGGLYSRARSRIVAGVMLAFGTVSFPAIVPAYAQMQLPGAVAPTGEGSVAAPAGPPKPRHVGPPPAPKVPSEDSLLNRTLEQNGRAGVLQFARDGKDVKLSKVVLGGEKISRPAESCTVEMQPTALVASGRPNGVTRYTAELAACPIAFDVLEGAILVAPRSAACEIAASDCRVDPAGLWGQPASEIGPSRTKEIERARAPAEQAMRNQFRSWLEQANKDRPMVQKISRYQAGFSSMRSEVCDRYARESEHGYCSLVLTQARSSALAAKVSLPDLPLPEPEPGRRKKR